MLRCIVVCVAQELCVLLFSLSVFECPCFQVDESARYDPKFGDSPVGAWPGACMTRFSANEAALDLADALLPGSVLFQ